MIKSNLKVIADRKGLSIRRISDDIDHGYETIRKLYNDEMERFPRDLLDKLCVYLNCSIAELIIYEKEQ